MTFLNVPMLLLYAVSLLVLLACSEAANFQCIHERKPKVFFTGSV